MPLNRILQGWLSCAFALLVWGVTFANTRALLVDFSALEIQIIRFALAWVTLLVVGTADLSGSASFALEKLCQFLKVGLPIFYVSAKAQKGKVDYEQQETDSSGDGGHSRHRHMLRASGTRRSSCSAPGATSSDCATCAASPSSAASASRWWSSS